MKQLLTKSMILLLTTACTFFSCTKSYDLSTLTANNKLIAISQPALSKAVAQASGKPSDSTSTTNTTPADTVTSKLPIADIITVGRWKVTSYIEGAENATSKFSSYVFTFTKDGRMMATANGITTQGFWKYVTAVYYYGIPVYGSSPDGFDIQIGSSKPLINLSKNLFIKKKTLTAFYLDSVKPIENTHVIFSKI